MTPAGRIHLDEEPDVREVRGIMSVGEGTSQRGLSSGRLKLLCIEDPPVSVPRRRCAVLDVGRFGDIADDGNTTRARPF